MFSSNFVMSVKQDGCFVEELHNGIVPIKFGEYVLYFKNDHNRRACVQIFIDGENVSKAGFIIAAYGSIEIKRHADSDRAFKFVDLNSKEARKAGKGGPNYDKQKGVIEARFFLEKEPPKVQYIPTPYAPYTPRPYDPWYIPPQYEPTYKYECKTRSGIGGQSLGGHDQQVTSFNCCSSPKSSVELDSCDFESAPGNLQDGATVKGNSTGQSFYSVSFDAETDYVSVRLFLQGYTHKIKRSKDDVIREQNREIKRLRKALRS